MHPSPRLNRFLSLIAATVIGNAAPARGAESICSAPLDPLAIIRGLDQRRPAPAGPEQRAAALRDMQRERQVHHLDLEDADKLHDLPTILRLHDREGVYSVILVDLPHARVGLHAKSIVMVSLPALRLLTSAEIRAVAAHEIGHEYVWDEYNAAKRRGDAGCLRQLELYCDAVAAITLRRAGLDPSYLVSGLSRVREFNRQFGKTRDEDWYPSVEERQAFIKGITEAAKQDRR